MASKDSLVVNTIVDEVRRRILDSKYAPGDRIREAELGKQFGVSRTPVREALRNLEASGLVEIIPHKGAVVCAQLSEKVVSDRMVAWRVLSAESGLLAALNATEGQKRELLRILKDMEELLDPARFSSSEAARLDWDFHLKVAEASGNSVLRMFIIQINERFLTISGKLTFPYERFRESVREHANIADAIVRGEAQNAYDYTQIHFRHSEDSNRKKVQEYRNQQLNKGRI